jgi:RNA polymerase sigma-70 factor (family 1)
VSNNKIDFREILERLVHGDQKSFDVLFTHFYPGLLRYAKSLLPHASTEAEDIVSDIFCNLWVNRQNLAITDSIASYLYRSVKNRIINTYKKNKLSLVDMNEVSNEAKGQSHQLPDQLLSFKQLNDRVNFLVTKLPEKTRLVFLMSREEGLTYEQIADVLDLSLNTIKTHMFRAIRFLKEAFNANDYLNLLVVGILS